MMLSGILALRKWVQDSAVALKIQRCARAHLARQALVLKRDMARSLLEQADANLRLWAGTLQARMEDSLVRGCDLEKVVLPNEELKGEPSPEEVEAAAAAKAAEAAAQVEAEAAEFESDALKAIRAKVKAETPRLEGRKSKGSGTPRLGTPRAGGTPRRPGTSATASGTPVSTTHAQICCFTALIPHVLVPPLVPSPPGEGKRGAGAPQAPALPGTADSL